MAGSGNLQTFRLLRYLRGRISAEGQVNYGLQMAVSIIIRVMSIYIFFEIKCQKTKN
jgi:hypothetical protein